MAKPNVLQIPCQKCKVAEYCPDKGSSPCRLANGRTMVFCKIVGGYGKNPIPPEKVSETSRKIQEKNGECLTIAEVPKIDEHTGKFYTEPVKVWHPPIRHPRELTTLKMDAQMSRSYKPDRR